MNDALSREVSRRMESLMATPAILRFQRDAAGNLHIPKGMMVTMRLEFSVPEMKEMGVPYRILNEHGRDMTDEEYAAALEAQDREQAAKARAAQE